MSAASGATRVAWTLEGVDGVDDRTGERSIPIVRAKAWQEREGAVVHALLHLENEREASMFFIAFDGAGVASERELRFSKTGQERFGAMMLTAPDGCFVRVIARSAGGSKVLDLELAESGPTRIHGSLEPSEEP